MFVKGTKVLGLKVITIDTGTVVEKVDDLVYDPVKHKVLALLVDKGGWFSDAKVILFEDVRSIGEDAVMIETKEVMQKASSVGERIASISKNNNYLTKTKIVTEDGTELGSVSDIYFDEKSGSVQEFEVSQGLANLQSGKKRVKVADIVTVGKDATIVRSYADEVFERQGEEQGLKGVMNSALHKSQDAAQKVKEQSQAVYKDAQAKKDDPKNKAAFQEKKQQTNEMLDKANSKISEFNEQVKNTFTNVKEKSIQTRKEMKENKKKDATGKYVTVNILGDNDQMIAQRGEMVTNDVMKKAEANNMLDKVLNNTSAEPVHAYTAGDVPEEDKP